MCVYIESYLLSGIGSHNYGGWQVQNFWGGLAGRRPKRADFLVQAGEQSVLQPGRAQVAEKYKGSLLENSLFVLFRPSTHGTRPTTEGEQSAFLSLPGPMPTPPKDTLIGTSIKMFDQVFGHPLAQPSQHIKLTITVMAGVVPHLHSKGGHAPTG